MKKIEMVKIILDEEEQQIYMDFIDLVDQIDQCLREKSCLKEKLTEFQNKFDEIVEQW